MQATSRPEHIWPDVWSNVLNNSRQKEKPHAATEKSKPHKSRQLRGIDYVDPDEKCAKSKKCKWNLQCRVHREIPQGVHP